MIPRSSGSSGRPLPAISSFSRARLTAVSRSRSSSVTVPLVRSSPTMSFQSVTRCSRTRASHRLRNRSPPVSTTLRIESPVTSWSLRMVLIIPRSGVVARSTTITSRLGECSASAIRLTTAARSSRLETIPRSVTVASQGGGQPHSGVSSSMPTIVEPRAVRSGSTSSPAVSSPSWTPGSGIVSTATGRGSASARRGAKLGESASGRQRRTARFQSSTESTSSRQRGSRP